MIVLEIKASASRMFGGPMIVRGIKAAAILALGCGAPTLVRSLQAIATRLLGLGAHAFLYEFRKESPLNPKHSQDIYV